MTSYEKAQQLIKKYGSNWAKHTEELNQGFSTIKKGDIFYTSWGYDQTNYDYIVVMEVSPTGKTVYLQ